MPYESESQRRLFYAKESRGELPEGTAERWSKETKKKGKRLPERKGKRKGKRRGRRSSRA